MKRVIICSLSLMMLAVTMGFLFSGCETGDGTTALTVSPTEVTLISDTNSSATVMTATFTVGSSTNSLSGGLRILSLPLEWSVTDPNLGSISAVGGTTAIYIRNNNVGVNTIIVRDQYGAEGVATVNQR